MQATEIRARFELLLKQRLEQTIPEQEFQAEWKKLLAVCTHPDFMACGTGHGLCPDCGYSD